MMEPVAWMFTDPDGDLRSQVTCVRQKETEDTHSENGLLIQPLVRLSDAEARIKELEALATDENKGLWRFWNAKAEILSQAVTTLTKAKDEAEARAEAAEALLKEAGKRLAWATKIIRSYVERDENDGLVLGQDFARLDTANEFLDKIGIKDE